MKIIIDLITFLLPVFYLVTVIAYGIAFLSKKTQIKKIKSPLLLATILLHFLYLILRTIYLKHPPIISVFDMFSLLAIAIASSYRIVEFRTGIRNTGFFILILSLLFQTFSSLFITDIFTINPVLRSNMLGIHVLGALIGYSAFTIAAVYAAIYMWQYNNIKKQRFNTIFEKLPNLEHLEKLTCYALKVGFLFLTVAILIGMIWLPFAITDFSIVDPKLIGSLLIWIMYGAGIFIIRKGKRTGIQIMKFAISGFLISLFSLTILNLYANTFHNFL